MSSGAKWIGALAIVAAVAAVAAVAVALTLGGRGDGGDGAAEPSSGTAEPSSGAAVNRETGNAPRRETGAAPPTSRPTLPPATPAADRFDGERRDPAWAGPLEAQLKEALERLGAAGEVDCRASICRVRLSGTEADLVKWTDGLAEDESVDEPESFSLSRSAADDGGSEVAIHLAYVR